MTLCKKDIFAQEAQILIEHSTNNTIATYFGSCAINSYRIHTASMTPAAVQGFHFVSLYIPLPQENSLIHRGTQQYARQIV